MANNNQSNFDLSDEEVKEQAERLGDLLEILGPIGGGTDIDTSTFNPSDISAQAIKQAADRIVQDKEKFLLSGEEVRQHSLGTSNMLIFYKMSFMHVICHDRFLHPAIALRLLKSLKASEAFKDNS